MDVSIWSTRMSHILPTSLSKHIKSLDFLLQHWNYKCKAYLHVNWNIQSQTSPSNRDLTNYEPGHQLTPQRSWWTPDMCAHTRKEKRLWFMNLWTANLLYRNNSALYRDSRETNNTTGTTLMGYNCVLCILFSYYLSLTHTFTCK